MTFTTPMIKVRLPSVRTRDPIFHSNTERMGGDSKSGASHVCDLVKTGRFVLEMPLWAVGSVQRNRDCQIGRLAVVERGFARFSVLKSG